LGVALVAAAVAFAWWEGGLHQFQAAAHWGILAVVALVLVVAVVGGVGRQATTSGQWVRGPLSVRRHLEADRKTTIAVLVWVALVLAVVGWDLNSFVHQSHHLPTLSSIFGHVTSTRAGRAGLVAAWLALGGGLALGWRRSR
jgi:uncharacterized membrane protein YidH (DUF202 family)